MLQEESFIEVADNSGVKVVRLIRIPGSTGLRYAKVGSIIVCSVRERETASKIKKGEVVKAVIVRTANRVQREDGSEISFAKNACVLINKDLNPIGTRVFGPVVRELRGRFMKICSLAHEVV